MSSSATIERKLLTITLPSTISTDPATARTSGAVGDYLVRGFTTIEEKDTVIGVIRAVP